MTFTDAVIQMVQGQRVARSIWTGYYLTILSSQKYIWSVGSTNNLPQVNASIYTPSTDDIFATDWIVKTN